jgi:hypothetical protein
MKTRYTNERTDLQRFAQKIAAWAKQGTRWAAKGDREMAQTHERDVQDLRAVYDAVKSGDYRHAAVLAYNLDTLVRDQIPTRLYNEINK